MIPNLTIAAPKDTNEFMEMLRWSTTFAHPLAIRYPRAGRVQFDDAKLPIRAGKWEYLHRANEGASAPVTVIAAGERSLLIAMTILFALQKQGKTFNVVNARFVKPLDLNFLCDLKSQHIITIEDNVFFGGLGAMIAGEIVRMQKPCVLKNFAYHDAFITHGKVGELQEKYGVSSAEIQEYILKCLS
jgi:1-deoxy-D-xylulose-5-phosphate synthase